MVGWAYGAGVNPTDSSWWWSHAFDAVASGLVTATAVLLTLWFDRRRTEDRELRNEVAVLEAAAWELARTLRGPDRGQFHDPSFRLWAQLHSTAAAARRRDKDFATDLEAAARRWTEIDDDRRSSHVFDRLDGLVGGVVGSTAEWRHDRKGYHAHDSGLFE